MSIGLFNIFLSLEIITSKVFPLPLLNLGFEQAASLYRRIIQDNHGFFGDCNTNRIKISYKVVVFYASLHCIIFISETIVSKPKTLSLFDFRQSGSIR
jgi:hypothetical protein